MITLSLFSAAVLGGHFVIVRELEIYSGRYSRFGFQHTDEENAPKATVPLATRDADLQIEKPVAFREVEAFDDDAKNWSEFFAQHSAGLVVFDANGDGKLDVYFCQNGQNWVRPTDEKAILQDKPRLQHNGLYLNTGNDAAGKPTFKQIKDLMKPDDANAEAELLVENFLFPRKSLSDSVERPGRQSTTAVAADFNGDGRPDLLVGNALPGGYWATPETSHVLSTFVNPIDRTVRKSKRYMLGLAPYVIKDYKARDNTPDERDSARGKEPFGANSLFLNLGDTDGDGVPEWQDASRSAGIEGRRNTMGLAVADIDLDGDLDVYESNIMDLDFWPGGAHGWAGALNQIYVNQLAETGELKFVERSREMKVDGLFNEENPAPEFLKLWRLPLLPDVYSLIMQKFVPYRPTPLQLNGQTAEMGEISWATVFQDVNGDGYPDIWVANDFTYLRLYLNQQGKGFVDSQHAESRRKGNWMSLTPGDFDGDLSEDLYAGNFGGGTFSNSFVEFPGIEDLFNPPVLDGFYYIDFNSDRATTKHLLVDGKDFSKPLDHLVIHSSVLPPDAALPNNLHKALRVKDFDPNGIGVYEFSWGSVALDVQNDGLLDLYFTGSVISRGGGHFAGVGATNPGRLLVGIPHADRRLRFADETAEHHLFNIKELQYDKLESDGYVYRKSPLQNWGKRDTVYSSDYSAWIQEGADILGTVRNSDLIQASENGRAVLAADLNGDGFEDLMIRNNGGYDSRSSKSKNLMYKRDGVTRALPSPDPNYYSLTNYEPGDSRVFMNSYTKGHWLKVHLVDDSPGALNRDAIGAKIVVNDRYLRVRRDGSGSFVSNVLSDVLVGLGSDVATSISVTWPDKSQTTSKLTLDGFSDGTVTISKTKGVVEWKPKAG